MLERLVVCFRWAPERTDEADFLAATAGQLERASVFGARVIAWHSFSFAVDYPVDAIVDAIDLLTEERPDPRFAIGVAEGPLEKVLEGNSQLLLCSGPPLYRAFELARMARAGEVLVDPALVARTQGELLTSGGRVRRRGESVLRGARLDFAFPRRSALSAQLGEIKRTRFIGPPARLDTLPGALSLLVAPRGFGGTRFLNELARNHEFGRVLRIAPHRPGEPLGSLRWALQPGAIEEFDELVSTHHALLQRLRQSEGLEPEGCVELLDTWRLGCADEVALVLIDDVEDVDAETLRVVVELARAGHARVVARTADESLVPEPLEELPQAALAPLSEWSPESVRAMVKSLAGQAIDDELCERLARRGGLTPGGVTATFEHAADTGEIVYGARGWTARTRRGGRGPGEPENHLHATRVRLLDRHARTVVCALAVLGGAATLNALDSLTRRVSRSLGPLEPRLLELERRRWVVRVGKSGVALPGHSHCDAVLQALRPDRLARWHQVTAAALVDGAGPLSAGAAALHAFLSGNAGKATLLARRAAASATAAGLHASAEAFSGFARSAAFELLQRQGLCGLWCATEAARTSSHAGLVAREPPALLRDGQPPPGPQGEALESSPMSSQHPSLELPTRHPEGAADHAAARSLRLPPDAALQAVPAPAPLALALELDEEAPTRAPTPPSTPEQELDLPPPREELLTGLEIEPLDAPLAEEPEKPSEPPAAPGPAAAAAPVELLTSLSAENAGEALRRLRKAKELARDDAHGHCRASLALALALSAIGRSHEALLESLESLATARRAGDAKGERACARFIAELSQRSGDDQSAEHWRVLDAI
jgi:hypothetical protein